MNTTFDFITQRTAWVAAGRPACLAWVHWAGVHAQSAQSNPDHATAVQLGGSR